MTTYVGVGISSFPSLVKSKTSHCRFQVRSERNVDFSISTMVNGVSSVKEKENLRSSIDKGNGVLGSQALNDDVSEKLEPFWDDGYGNVTVKDYFAAAKDFTHYPDGGPPRWFCPLDSGSPLKDSPILLFLPGMDGTGWGLIMHHKALGKAFEVRCLHIPVQDRTPFEGLVKLVEETIRIEHASSPDKPIYLVGESFGGCLALAVASRNPKIDLVLVLVNPATSFGRSQLQPLFPLLGAIPDVLHGTVPYLLSFVMGEPVKMATVNVESRLPPMQQLEKVSQNLTSLLPYLSDLAGIVPKDTLLWKLKLLKSAAAYANSRLYAVKAEVLVLASGKDNMVPSDDEARRLGRSLQNCTVLHFKENGHTLLLEDSIGLMTVIKGTCKYRRSRRHDFVLDYIPPSVTECRYAFDRVTGLFRFLAGPAMFSTLEDGTIVKGLTGVPNEGPVLLVGYHNLLGMELAPLVEEFLIEKSVVVRGIAHPELFSGKLASKSPEFSFTDWIKVFGAVPVSAGNIYKLLSEKSHVLLYPGGAREALHYKGEEYKLFWPDQPEFVRMAAHFGATIVPFGVVGEDDIAQILLDSNDLKNIPVVNDYVRGAGLNSIRARNVNTGKVSNIYFPLLLPKMPGRLYYLFGKPIETKGKEKILKDRQNASQLYVHIKSEVERCLAYLIKKREEDPYRNLIDRTVHKAVYASQHEVPTFEP